MYFVAFGSRDDLPTARSEVLGDETMTQWQCYKSSNAVMRSWLFAGQNRPDTRVWQNPLKRAGLMDFRWHDLRHTWASWHAQSGTPLQVLQEMGGWETTEMVRRYAHLGAEHLAQHAARIAGRVTFLAQPSNFSGTVAAQATGEV